jgi:hypothetical protein
MTDIIQNTFNESILLEIDWNQTVPVTDDDYPQQWLDTAYRGTLFTNRQIMEDISLDPYGDWFNPG